MSELVYDAWGTGAMSASAAQGKVQVSCSERVSVNVHGGIVEVVSEETFWQDMVVVVGRERV